MQITLSLIAIKKMKKIINNNWKVINKLIKRNYINNNKQHLMIKINYQNYTNNNSNNHNKMYLLLYNNKITMSTIINRICKLRRRV